MIHPSIVCCPSPVVLKSIQMWFIYYPRIILHVCDSEKTPSHNSVKKTNHDLHINLLQGASVVVYKNEEIRKHQLFSYTGWPGGLFGSTTMAGTRSGKTFY